MLHAFCLFFLFADPPEASQANALLRQGLLELQQNKLAEARSDLELFSRTNPENAVVWVSLAQTYLKLNDSEKARVAADKASKIPSENPAVHHALAIIYVELQDFKQAAPLERKFALSAVADHDALNRAASLYLNAGDPQAALELAQKAFAQTDSNANRALLGRAEAAAGQLQDGIAHLAAAWTSEPANPQICFDYAQALLYAGNFGVAGDAIEKTMTLVGPNTQLQLTLGVVRYGQRRFDEAIRAFLKTIQLDPSAEQPYLFLGKMMDQAGANLPEITEDYRNWLAHEPNNPLAPLMPAKAESAAAGKPEEISQLLHRSIELDPNNWESHYELGLLFVKQHKYPEAAEELTHSIQLNEKEPMTHYHLSRVYDRLGKSDLAARERTIHQQLTAHPSPAGMEVPPDPPRAVERHN